MLSKFKVWALAAGGFIVAIGVAVLYLIGVGKKTAKADAYEEALHEESDFQKRVDSAAAVGDAGLHPLPDDPNDRAVQRRRKT